MDKENIKLSKSFNKTHFDMRIKQLKEDNAFDGCCPFMDGGCECNSYSYNKCVKCPRNEEKVEMDNLSDVKEIGEGIRCWMCYTKLSEEDISKNLACEYGRRCSSCEEMYKKID